MTRPDLLALLAALANAGRLTRPQATALVTAYDAGALADADLPAFPAVGAILAALVRAAIIAVPRRIANGYARLRGFQAPTAAQVPALARAALAQPLPVRLRILDATRANDVRGALSREIERRTTVLYAGRDAATFGPGEAGSARRSAGEVSRWQRATQQAMADDAATLARLGAGGDLTAGQAERLARVVARQGEYVDRYAVHLTQSAAGQAKVLSEAQVRAGIVRQSGDARALFFDNAGEAEAAGMDAPVYDYADRDAPSTCSPCRDAAAGSPYLVGQGPIPGRECLGGGACHCEITVYNNPTEYARLGGT